MPKSRENKRNIIVQKPSGKIRSDGPVAGTGCNSAWWCCSAATVTAVATWQQVSAIFSKRIVMRQRHSTRHDGHLLFEIHLNQS